MPEVGESVSAPKGKDDYEDDYVPFVSIAERKRRLAEAKKARREAKRRKALEEDESEDSSEDEEEAPIPKKDLAEHPSYQNREVALVDVADDLREQYDGEGGMERAKAEQEEKKALETVTAVQRKALMSKDEHAKGIVYTKSMDTGWKPLRRVRELSNEQITAIRKKYRIEVFGEDVPPPVTSFKRMRLSRPFLEGLRAKNIIRPTPIQIQGLPVALSGRDMIGIAFTGSGKTITFTLPMVAMALGEELKKPIMPREGPFGLILGPSRELQRQTYEVAKHLCEFLFKGGYPMLSCTLVIGGEDKRNQLRQFESRGTHMMVATPGRLNDFLQNKKMNLDVCKYICLDEGDRMMDLGFDEEVQHTLSFFKGQRQTLLFSATMPKKVIDFAQTSLVRPITVNIGRAGAANLDVVQEVEYVKQESKIVYLLQCLRKSAPPVLIFCEKKDDVDDIYEYLLLKGVDAVCIHGGKDQAERNRAISSFKDGLKDVLVATDIAAKGLDFPEIQHVINFDMPPEIENYVHRIGRTGRQGKTGIATTFINKDVDESTLLDLKHLLVEAKQRVPPVLAALKDPQEESRLERNSAKLEETLGKGCSYCGGLGHRITNCPKLQTVVRSQKSSMRDVVKGGRSGW